MSVYQVGGEVKEVEHVEIQFEKVFEIMFFCYTYSDPVRRKYMQLCAGLQIIQYL